MPMPIRIWWINTRAAYHGRKYRLSLLAESDDTLFRAEDSDTSLVIARLGRRRRYNAGVKARIDLLAKEYQIHDLQGLSGGLLLDCGANVGELGMWAQWQGMSYIAFEPEELEARACDLNNFNGDTKTLRKALWHEETTLSFYRAPDSADSSLFAGTAPVETVEIEATTLDQALSNSDLNLQDIDGPKILKLEAEGAEPEILQGAASSLPKIDWVTVDCGPERGASKENTFVPVHNLLTAAGFTLMSVQFGRVTALYKRTS